MNKREIVFTNQFKRDLKKYFLMLVSAEWIEVLSCLLVDEALPEKYRDHALIGNWVGTRECHLKPDLLLIYLKENNELRLLRLGSHAELFG